MESVCVNGTLWDQDATAVRLVWSWTLKRALCDRSFVSPFVYFFFSLLVPCGFVDTCILSHLRFPSFFLVFSLLCPRHFVPSCRQPFLPLYPRPFVCLVVRVFISSFLCAFVSSAFFAFVLSSLRLFGCSCLHFFVPLCLRVVSLFCLRTLVPSFVWLFVSSFLRSFVPSFRQPFLPSYSRPFVCLVIRVFISSFLRAFVCWSFRVWLISCVFPFISKSFYLLSLSLPKLFIWFNMLPCVLYLFVFSSFSLVFGDWVIMPKVDANLAVVTLVVRTRGTVNKLRASVAAVKASREDSAMKSRPGISSLYQITWNTSLRKQKFLGYVQNVWCIIQE